MSDLTIALAGGAIGSLFTVGVSFARRLAAVRSEVERNDFDAAERNDDLETWVADEHRQLGFELSKKRGQLAQAGQATSGAFGASMAIVKGLFLHRYRDQERQARRDVASIRAREDWTHRVYRRWRKLPEPQLAAVARVQPVLDSWRAPARQADGTQVAVHDATQHSLDDTISALRANSP